MAGVMLFKNGALRYIVNPGGNQPAGRQHKLLVHLPTNEVITSNEMLTHKLALLGWERYPSSAPSLIQFHQRSSVHLISVPADFSRFGTIQMYDIVVKCPDVFEVRDA